jgi:hypothetical protein
MADQFGGPKGKKFKYKSLKDLLIEISSLPMIQQQAQLEKSLKDWKGDLEQVDDVLCYWSSRLAHERKTLNVIDPDAGGIFSG